MLISEGLQAPALTPAPDTATQPILVAVRDTSTRNPSIEWAARRAEATALPLTLVHAVPGADLMPPGIPYAGVVAAGRALLQAESARLTALFPGLRVGTYLHCGDVVHALLGLSVDAPLLVVGADRVDARTGAFRGSVAFQVGLGSVAPVIVVPFDHRDTRRSGSSQGHVVVGVDGSAESCAALTRAATEAHSMGAALRVVTAVKPSMPGAEALTAGTSAMLLAIHARYPLLVVSWVVDVLRPPARALTRHSRDAALLVIGRHGRGARRTMDLGSVTHSLLLRLPCPTLVITSPVPEPIIEPPAAATAAQHPGIHAGSRRAR